MMDVLAWLKVLARRKVLAAGNMLPLGMLAHAHALAYPDRARAEHAPQFAGTRQVSAVPRAQREVLVVAWQVTNCLTTVSAITASDCLTGRGASAQASGGAAAGRGEPVVRIRPGCRLLRVLPGCADALR